MREEIEAAVTFITRLVNKSNLSQAATRSTSTSNRTHSQSCPASSSPSSTSSSSSTSSASSSCSDGHPSYDDPTLNVDSEQDKLEQFKQCLTDALYERFHDHWFPEQPTKGQAYRCIRLNSWDRHDIALQKACDQCGIEYKDLQLPVELTLWVDPEEVTCRFGETKGSHCLVAKFTSSHVKDKDFNLGI